MTPLNFRLLQAWRVPHSATARFAQNGLRRIHLKGPIRCGNSGLIIMGLYELQVLDSYNAKTYADGQAAAIYGQYPPLVNASRGPGEWQTYDVIFRQPRFDATGHLVSRARETVIHNGIVVQDSSH